MLTIWPCLAEGQRVLLKVTNEGKGRINPMVDNMGYWRQMARLGYVETEPSKEVPAAIFNGTQIKPWFPFGSPAKTGCHPEDFSGISPQNSPDIPVTGESDVTQSENSVFTDPGDEYSILNSNNSSSWISGYAQDPFGADALWSSNGAVTWQGSTAGVNGNNGGDPAVAIGLNGWWYVGRITADNGQAVSYSKNKGLTWTRVKVGQGPVQGYGLLDKNHLWIDNSPLSPYKGNLYAAWTNFIPGSPDTNQVQVVRSADGGITWSSPWGISSGVSAQKLNHGVTLQTGPNGEVYAAWSIYDTWPSDETAIGFTKSIDGGGIFVPATRIIGNLKGIRTSLTSKQMRVHAFPSMAVDISQGPRSGNIYIVFPNIGYPGINTGNDIDIYLIRSTDGGSTWSVPIRVNQDPPGLGKEHFHPWITCDPVTGGLCVIYYDDRNTDSTRVATFVSYSYDGGMSWSDLQVSDHTFTPQPIPGLAFSYFGDYLGIQSNNMQVYPVWTDNHEGGRAMSYASPFFLGPNPGQPWVMYHSDSLAPVTGSGPSALNFGDSLYLTLGLKNVGDQPAGTLTSHISSPSPYVTITDSVEFYNSIGPGEVKKIANGYTVRVSDTIPDNLTVRFNVKAVSPDSSAYSWQSHFSLQARAPGLEVGGMTIVDTLGGNRNGRMDPGETVKIVVRLINSGDFPCPGTIGRLSTFSPWLTLLNDSVILGDILPGLEKDAVFGATVAESAPPGSGTELTCRASSGKYHRQRIFRQVIGQVAEDWESNSFTRFNWQQGGAKPWTISTQSPWEGLFCVRSGAVNDYQNSQLSLTYTSSADDSISFYVRTSSEQDYDYVLFSIDAVWQGQWSGNTPWTRAAFPVSAGTHTFKWIYLKDLSYALGEDCAWIDFIALPPPVLPEVDPGINDTLCAGTAAMLQATVSGHDSIRWSTSGDGIFGNDTALVTFYQPGTGDISTGHADLLLTAWSAFGSSTGQKRITINPSPVTAITSLPGDTACAGNPIMLVADTSNIREYLWMPGAITTSAAVYDTALTGGSGAHKIRLTVVSRQGCTSADSVIIHFKDCTPVYATAAGTWWAGPSPGDGMIEVRVPGESPERLFYSVYDAAGVPVTGHKTAPEISTGRFSADLTKLAEGVYLLKLEAGQRTAEFKIVILK